MGAVVSCVESVFRTIGSVIMAIISGVGSILMAIINGIVTFCGIIVSFLTCGYCSHSRRGTGGGMGSSTGTRRGWGRRRHGVTTTSRI